MRQLLMLIIMGMSLPVFAQGQDSTPAERNLLIMAEMLPGVYDNANQAYFDERRGLPDEDRHQRTSTTITRIDAPAFGDFAFLWVNDNKTADGGHKTYRIATLSADGGPDEVRMRHYLKLEGEIGADELATLEPRDLRRTEGCDYYFKRRADHFRGAQRDKACQFRWGDEDVYTANTIELSGSDLWFVDHKYVEATGKRITGVASGEPLWLERAREFHCYADIPGVAGGRDIPFERYDNMTIHDRGGIVWFETRDEEARNIGITLRRVTWHVNNEVGGNFNRDSLVLYVLERMPDGKVESHTYTFTQPDAERIGMNMKWMLVNCAITPRHEAVPGLR